MNQQTHKTLLLRVQTATEDGGFTSYSMVAANELVRKEDGFLRMNKRKAAFVLTSTDHGTMIVNRFDYKMVSEDSGFGVGHALLTNGEFESSEIDAIKQILELRCRHHGAGVHVLDIGANIGVHTLSWAKHMFGWGTLLAIEPQEPIYYALCGNIVLNNCVNAKALWAACGAEDGCIDIPQPDYMKPGTFGSLELRKSAANEDIGQPIDYDANLATVPMLRVDTLGMPRVDLIKIDVENMEPEVLAGARETVARHKPVLMVEAFKDAHQQTLQFFAEHGYHWLPFGLSLLAFHDSDPVRRHISWEDYNAG